MGTSYSNLILVRSYVNMPNVNKHKKYLLILMKMSEPFALFLTFFIKMYFHEIDNYVAIITNINS